MKLNLTKPLVIFDLEATGLDLVNDRIIQISFIKAYPDGKEEREHLYQSRQADSVRSDTADGDFG